MNPLTALVIASVLTLAKVNCPEETPQPIYYSSFSPIISSPWIDSEPIGCEYIRSSKDEVANLFNNHVNMQWIILQDQSVGTVSPSMEIP